MNSRVLPYPETTGGRKRAELGSMTDLYGGALTAALPAGWIDASDLRPVPDNQEVCDST